jgi:hypothetical protein
MGDDQHRVKPTIKTTGKKRKEKKRKEKAAKENEHKAQELVS